MMTSFLVISKSSGRRTARIDASFGGGELMTDLSSVTRGVLLLVAALLTFSPALAEDPDLLILDYIGSQTPGAYPSYLELHEQLPTLIPFGDEDEAFNIVTAGTTADAVALCGGSMSKWTAAQLLAPLNTGRLAEWPRVQARFRDYPTFKRDGLQMLVPLYWGNTGLVYRTDLLSQEDAASLRILADPRFKGRVAIGDNIDDAFALAFLVIGRNNSSSNLTEEDIIKALDFLRQVHANGANYWSDADKLAAQLQSGEVALAWAWNETAARLSGEGRPVTMNFATKEGISTWICGYARLANGLGSDDKLYDFLDAILSDRAARYQLDVKGYFPTNLTTFTEADASALHGMGLQSFDQLLATSVIQSSYDPATRARLVEEFEKIKAGN
jgi:spermidine/putrescine-binding protein